MPTTLRVVRATALPINQFLPFDRTATDAVKVQHFYTFIGSLPPAPSGAWACPDDEGLRYDLTFLRGSTPALQAVAVAEGCTGLVINGQDDRQVNDAFWSQLAQTIGVNEPDLFVRPIGTP